MKTVSEAYLLGIREGRAMLNSVMAASPDDPAHWRAVMAVEASPMPGFSGDVAQFNRGVRDFARHWLRKGIGQ